MPKFMLDTNLKIKQSGLVSKKAMIKNYISDRNHYFQGLEALLKDIEALSGVNWSLYITKKISKLFGIKIGRNDISS